MNETENRESLTARLMKDSDEHRSKSSLSRYLWGIGGVVSFALGTLGAVLPLIPTTPFILLAALCFARSSKRLDTWFRSTKLYKTVFEGLLTRKAMTLSAKLKLLVPISSLLFISFALMGSVPIGRAVVAIIFVGHIAYFGFVVKTEKPQKEADLQLGAQGVIQED